MEILEAEGIAILVRDLNEESVRHAAAAAVELAGTSGLSARCVQVARRYFSLESGVAVYERVYRQLEGAALRS